MKIGTETLAFREKLDEKTLLKMIADAGFDCVDYTFFDISGNSPEWLLSDDYLKNAQTTAELLTEYGLSCYQTHAPFTIFKNTPLDESHPTYRGIIRSLEYSAVIGAKCCVVHAISPEFGMDVVKFNQPFYAGLAETAKKTGVKIAIENLFRIDPTTNRYIGRLADPDELCRLIKELPEDCFTVCLDTGHAAMCGIEPDEFLRKIPQGMVTALHVHDNNRKNDLHLLPYLCDINWNRFLAALKDYGFKDVFNLEIVHFFDRMPVELWPAALKLAAETARRMCKEL